MKTYRKEDVEKQIERHKDARAALDALSEADFYRLHIVGESVEHDYYSSLPINQPAAREIVNNFLVELARYHGRQVIRWETILDGGDPDATVATAEKEAS